MKTSKETLRKKLENCLDDLIDADISLHYNNEDGKGWILHEEFRAISYRINDIIEYVEIIIRSI